MRILVCLHASPIENAAGVEVYSDALARTLRASHDVALLYPGTPTGAELREFDERGIRHFVVRETRPARSFAQTYRNPRIHRDLEQVLDSFHPDVVHVQHLMGLSIDLPALAQARGVPVVMTVHDYWLQCAAGGQRFHRSLGRCDEVSVERCGECTAHLSAPAMQINTLLDRMGVRVGAPAESGSLDATSDRAPRANALVRGLTSVASRATRVRPSVQRQRIQERWDALLGMADEVDRFLVPSSFMKDEMIRFGLPKVAVNFVELGTAAHHQGAPRVLPETAKHFGYLGGITRHKGVHHLIDAANHFPDEMHVTIWGNKNDDPTYAAELRALATHAGITFAGPLAQRDVPKHLREIDALVVPSLWFENSPLVIREAFSAGIPVVATRLGGHVELLAQGGGLLYDPDTQGELHRVLKRLTTEPGLGRSLVEKQPRVTTMTEHATEVAEIFRSIANEIECD